MQFRVSTCLIALFVGLQVGESGRLERLLDEEDPNKSAEEGRSVLSRYSHVLSRWSQRLMGGRHATNSTKANKLKHGPIRTNAEPAWSSKRNDPDDESSEVAENEGLEEKRFVTKLLLFTKAGGEDRYESEISGNSSISELKASGFVPARKTVLYIHGFRGRGLRGQTWFVRMKELIMARYGGANVIFVDWSKIARTYNYLTVKKSIKKVAEEVNTVLLSLQRAQEDRVDFSKVHLIGHSLGAHICGILGRLISAGDPKKLVQQISALDPTDVYLKREPLTEKLSADDARYVVAYHTDTDLGTPMGLGDRDIFFNGGNYQPVCWLTGEAYKKFGCSHRAATKYLSVQQDRCMMIAYACTSYQLFKVGECGFCRDSSSDCVTAGFEWQYEESLSSLVPSDLPVKTRQSRPWLDPDDSTRYFVETDSKEPYCVFTYQIVMKVGLSQRTSFDSIKLELYLESSNHSVQVELKNQIGESRAGPEVFVTDEATRQIEGPNVLTGLLSVGRESGDIYARLPDRFARARLVQELMREVSAEVYANFMSHSSYQTRAKNSGKLELMVH